MIQQDPDQDSNTLGETRPPDDDRVLRYSALIFAAGLVVHGADHWRRGFGVVTPEVFWGGAGLLILGVAAVALVLMKHRRSPLFATGVGFITALTVAASHLLPHWGPFSDAFPGGGVGVLSYAAVFAEITGALVFGAAGTYVLQRTKTRQEQIR